ncbi:MAG TPA: VanZ family protein [Candidatus Acidoferrales bacterium]|nr:VanZ family protein [Candidatus Acidoferrales bacterium]
MPSRSEMPWVHRWGPVIVWACVISTFSTHLFTSEHTESVVIPVLRWLLPHAPLRELLRIHAFLRKCGHVVEFFIFSVLVMRGFRAGRREWRWGWALWTLFICACVASLDEFHQYFVLGRTATPWDSLLDTTAAAAALVAMLFLWWLARRPRNAGL